MRTNPLIRVALVAAFLAGGACILTGCTTAGGRCADDGVLRSECLVCRRNGDLACVCVRIEPDTPRCEHGGATYYFCSEDCKRDFLKDPARYLPKTP